VTRLTDGWYAPDQPGEEHRGKVVCSQPPEARAYTVAEIRSFAQDLLLMAAYAEEVDRDARQWTFLGPWRDDDTLSIDHVIAGRHADLRVDDSERGLWADWGTGNTVAEAEAAVRREVEGLDYDHDARPDDDPEPGDRCKTCGEDITWIGPHPTSDWMHVGDRRNR
jgi:hypothetical protein